MELYIYIIYKVKLGDFGISRTLENTFELA